MWLLCVWREEAKGQVKCPGEKGVAQGGGLVISPVSSPQLCVLGPGTCPESASSSPPYLPARGVVHFLMAPCQAEAWGEAPKKTGWCARWGASADELEGAQAVQASKCQDAGVDVLQILSRARSAVWRAGWLAAGGRGRCRRSERAEGVWGLLSWPPGPISMG